MSIIKNFKVTSVEGEPYNIPNTEINIWKLKGEVNGVRDLYSTMSKVIATEGFVGDVELYTNPKGKEYIRQAPKEDKPSGGGSGHSTEDSIARAVALKAAVESRWVDHPETALKLADRYLAWLKNGEVITSVITSESAKDVVQPVDDDAEQESLLNDIPLEFK